MKFEPKISGTRVTDFDIKCDLAKQSVFLSEAMKIINRQETMDYLLDTFRFYKCTGEHKGDWVAYIDFDTLYKIAILEKYPEFNDSWYDYANTVNGISTVEDFLKPEYVERLLNKSYPGFSFDKKKNTIQNIDSIVSSNSELKQNLKKELICNATVKDIKSEYKMFIQEIAKKIKKICE